MIRPRAGSRNQDVEPTAGKSAGELRRASWWAAAPRAAAIRMRSRTYLSEHPAVYLPLARRRYPGPSPSVIGPATQLVIDGYTRSATTFAVYAFQLAQERPVRLAHHLHAPAQLIAAARRRVPTIALIREPRGAILSQLVREPDVSMREALVAYARFYESLRARRERFVIGEFEEVRGDFPAVIRRVNDRFGTAFGVFEPTEGNVRECMDLVRERPTPIAHWSRTLLSFESGIVDRDEVRRAYRRFGNDPASIEAGATWVPSEERERAKEALSEAWSAPALAGLRRRTETAYARFVEPSR